MGRKIIALLLASFMLLELAGCGKEKDVEVKVTSNTPNVVQTNDNTTAGEGFGKGSGSGATAKSEKDYDPATYWVGHWMDAFYGGEFRMFATETTEDYTFFSSIEMAEDYLYADFGIGDSSLRIGVEDGNTYFLYQDLAYKWGGESNAKEYGIAIDTDDIDNLPYLRSEDGYDIYSLDDLEVYIDHEAKAVSYMYNLEEDIIVYIYPLTSRTFKASDYKDVEEVESSEEIADLFVFCLMDMVITEK